MAFGSVLGKSNNFAVLGSWNDAPVMGLIDITELQKKKKKVPTTSFIEIMQLYTLSVVVADIVSLVGWAVRQLARKDLATAFFAVFEIPYRFASSSSVDRQNAQSVSQPDARLGCDIRAKRYKDLHFGGGRKGGGGEDW